MLIPKTMKRATLGYESDPLTFCCTFIHHSVSTNPVRRCLFALFWADTVLWRPRKIKRFLANIRGMDRQDVIQRHIQKVYAEKCFRIADHESSAESMIPASLIHSPNRRKFRWNFRHNSVLTNPIRRCLFAQSLADTVLWIPGQGQPALFMPFSPQYYGSIRPSSPGQSPVRT